MRSMLIWAGPYLDILAHKFLPDRSGKPIPSWRASSPPGCGRRRRRTAALLQPAGRERMGSELGRDVFKNVWSTMGVWQRQRYA